MNNITGALYRVTNNLKQNEVHPGKVSVTSSSVQNAMSSGSSGTTEVMAHPDGWRVSGPEVTAVAISRRSRVKVIGKVWWCRAVQTPIRQHIHNLNLTRSGTRNQWRSLSNGEMWSVLLAVKIRRTAAFRTDCSRS